MRVVLLAESIQPPLTGIGRYAWELAQGLGASADIEEASFLSSRHWVSQDELRCRLSVAPKRQVADARSLLHLGALKQRLKSGLASIPSIATKYEKLRQIVGYARLMRMQSQLHTVVHGPNYFAPPSDFPTAVTIHDLSTFLFPETHPASRVRRVEVMLKTAIREGFTIITDAQCTANDLVTTVGVAANKIHVVHLGVSSSFRLHSPTELRSVLARYELTHGAYTLSVGTAEPRKNLVRLLDAYEALPTSVRGIYPLVLVGGKGWNDGPLIQRIERGMADGWVRNLGYVQEADLPFLYGGARLFAYVSLYEGFGLPVAEAMACGTPVVTSNTSSMPEVAAGAALLVNPNDTEQIKECLLKALQDDDWRAGATQQGLIRASELSWSKTVADTIAVYRNMLSEN